ncbi:MAG: response regulator transcription factor [Sphingobacteriales bacterium]|nr:response regulator transcription factor [Sphingobacteriales bacterium]MBI3719213.1 response regulator transcription factor [Sphingobacteriales bacterium]
MEKLRAVLIDDELSSLQNLKQKLIEFCPDINVIAVAQQPEEALLLIRHHKPDVIFLDIEMPRMSGFRMLDELGSYDFEIIFTTAYNHYAVEAIRISAFDYLTKPISIADLQNAVQRLVKERQSISKERIDILKQSLSGRKSQEDKIAVPTAEGLEFLQIKNIIHIESSANYSKLFLTGGKNMLVTKLLKDFEDILLPYRFYRVHNSHLINLNYIQKYIRGEGGQVILQNGDVIDVARRKKDEFLKLIT